MSMKVSSVHKIVFRDLDVLVDGFQRLVRNISDIDALYVVCDRIDVVWGSSDKVNRNCDAEYLYNAGNYRSHKTFVLRPVLLDPHYCVPIS